MVVGRMRLSTVVGFQPFRRELVGLGRWPPFLLIHHHVLLVQQFFRCRHDFRDSSFATVKPRCSARFLSSFLSFSLSAGLTLLIRANDVQQLGLRPLPRRYQHVRPAAIEFRKRFSTTRRPGQRQTKKRPYQKSPHRPASPESPFLAAGDWLLISPRARAILIFDRISPAISHVSPCGYSGTCWRWPGINGPRGFGLWFSSNSR